MIQPRGKTTSAGMWRYARDYLDAAAVVSKAKGGRFSAPAHFLYGHSIELVLKAFLLARGVPYTDLRSKAYGHSLLALLKESRRRKLGLECHLDRKALQTITLLDASYSTKRHEYIETGVYTVPVAQDLLFLTVHLVTSLERYCINSAYPGARP